jgi:hypothetical protein
MYGLRNHGLGRTPAEDAVCRAGTFGGFFTPVCWTALTPSTVAPPRAPSGDVLTVPPASGEEAQATVDALLDQQLRDQQALNAAGVQSSWLDRASSQLVAAGDSLSSPWLLLGALGLGVFALVAVGGGSPRRYGR